MNSLTLPTLALTLGALVWATPQPQSAVDALAFPLAAGPVEIPAQVEGRPTSVGDLIEIYAAATGQSFVHAHEDIAFAQGTPLGLAGALTVPAGRLQAVFEGLLLERDFILQVVSTEGPRVLSARCLQTAVRNTVRSRAIYVAGDRVDLMRAHPAMILTTVLDLPRLEVRALSNSLRTMIVDANTQQLLPAGASSSLVLTAPGGQLATWVETLNRLHELAPEPTPPAAAGDSGR